MVKVLLNNDVVSYSKCKCERPVRVITRTGHRLYVGCGQCPACLAKRRNSWSFRLEQEYKSTTCIHAFGWTFTYDSQHVPYLTKKELEEKTYQYDYDTDKNHPTIILHHGCDSERLKPNGDCVALLEQRHVQLCYKRFAKWLKKTYSDVVYCRYYVSPEYGETFGTTSRPHYHGINYIHTTQPINDIVIINQISKECEAKWLSLWQYAERRWDAKKRMWFGKDIHKFGEKWGNYLGKYINKVEASKYDTGAKYIPPRSMCSRQSSYRNKGSIGSNYILENPALMVRYLSELKTAVATRHRFNPTYNENGYVKALPRALKNQLIEIHFGVKFSYLANYIWWRNFFDNRQKVHQTHREKDDTDPFNILYKDYQVFDYPQIRYIAKSDRLPFDDEIDHYDKWGNYTHTAIVPAYSLDVSEKKTKIMYHRRQRTPYSIATPPLIGVNEWEYDISELPQTFVKQYSFTDRVRFFYRILHLIQFLDIQTDRYTDSVSLLVVDRHIKLAARLNKDGTLTALTDTIRDDLHDLAHRCVTERRRNLAACASIRQKALYYKYKHDRKNGYTASTRRDAVASSSRTAKHLIT